MSQLETSPEIIDEDKAAKWKPPMPPQDLIFDDGEPLESNRHRIGMNVLIDSVYEYWDATERQRAERLAARLRELGFSEE